MPLDENAPDADLLSLAAAGNGEAFGILMRRHEDRMFYRRTFTVPAIFHIPQSLPDNEPS